MQSEKLQKKCAMLEKNLSVLYKTAWAHLHRKDGHIERLKESLKETRRRAYAGLPLVDVPGDDDRRGVRTDVRRDGTGAAHASSSAGGGAGGRPSSHSTRSSSANATANTTAELPP